MSSRVMRSLGELARSGALEFGDGYRTKRSEHGTPGYRIIRVADINDGAIQLDGPDFVSVVHSRSIGAKAGQSGDVLLTTKGTVGRVAIVPETSEQIVYSPQVCYFRVTDSDVIDPRYLGFWFRSAEFASQAAHRMNNTDMAAYINLADIRSLTLQLPDICAQRAIAEVLGAFDDKINANTNLAATAEKLAVASLADQRATVPLRNAVSLHRHSVSPDSMDEPTVDHFSLPAFDSGVLPTHDSPRDIKSSKFRLEGPVVLLSKLNPRFPRVWNVEALGSRSALASTEFLVLVPRKSTTAVLWAVLSQPGFSLALDAKVSGTSGSHQRVKPDDALNTLIVDPSAISPDRSALVTNLVSLAGRARIENRTLAATRDALLPLLMSGKLRVRDAEKVLEGVL